MLGYRRKAVVSLRKFLCLGFYDVTAFMALTVGAARAFLFHYSLLQIICNKTIAFLRSACQEKFSQPKLLDSPMGNR
ncbi:MAG: hypothetical protein A3H27_16755 [Acidobacteria bacterium RIFCSPLOWO2_02_FULL_59_13]|nr:MAG: hypothetical protein A3H27_16755 [Acidobacteria bacterium RIFCSPLOWO2_02_FULL_59_13]